MRLRHIIIGFSFLLFAAGAAAQSRQDALPAVFDGVGIDEKLGESIPTDLTFFDEEGEAVTLDRFFDGSKPVVLNFVYHNCPMLCSLLLESFTRSMKEMEWTAGGEFDVLTVSFSAKELPDLASSQKTKYVSELGREQAASGWHFLTGTEENIFALAAATGFNFKWVESTEEFAHPAALIFLDGNAKITRYIHGMNFPPADLRKAIVEASEGRVGTTVDRILLYCYRYDASANSYVLSATRIMKVGGGLTLLVVCLGLLYFWRRERRNLAARQFAANPTLTNN